MKMETLEKFTLNNNTTDSNKLRIVSWKLPKDQTTMELFIQRLTKNNPQWKIDGYIRDILGGLTDIVGFKMKNPDTGTIVEFDGIQNLIIWHD